MLSCIFPKMGLSSNPKTWRIQSRWPTMEDSKFGRKLNAVDKERKNNNNNNKIIKKE
jgi:hypothetical protein